MNCLTNGRGNCILKQPTWLPIADVYQLWTGAQRPQFLKQTKQTQFTVCNGIPDITTGIPDHKIQ